MIALQCQQLLMHLQWIIRHWSGLTASMGFHQGKRLRQNVELIHHFLLYGTHSQNLSK